MVSVGRPVYFTLCEGTNILIKKKLFRKTEGGCHLHDTKLPVKYRVNKTISEGFNSYACTKRKKFPVQN